MNESHGNRIPAPKHLAGVSPGLRTVKSTAVPSEPSTPDPQQPLFTAEVEAPMPPRPWWSRILSLLHPTHAHSVFSATVVLMVSTFLSRIIGLVRVKYIAWLFGRGMEADALNAAFYLPDIISYFLVGGAASITFITILSRYREQGREADAQRSLSVIISTMLLVLGAALVLAEIFTPWCVGLLFHGFDAPKTALCVLLTRILLPAQLCFFAGGIFAAVLLVRRQFIVQAVAPLVYGLGTVAGGLLLVKRLGVSSLALGTVAGAVFGPLLLNWYFAHRAGTRYRFILDWRDAGLREWVRLSLPLMAGVSLVPADNWIIAYFASTTSGAVSLMAYAKQLFAAPMAMLAQAAGAASMPFFASLWSRDRQYEFATGVADSVSRVASLGLLAASLMVSLGWPAIDLVFTGGHFSPADARLCSIYFAIFSVTMFLWSAQAIYARAFYAAGNTLVPMVASTMVTAIALPVYAALYRQHGAAGLALASDIGIALQTVTIAALLHKRRMVSIASLDFAEMGRCLLSACAGGAAAWFVAWALSFSYRHLPGVQDLPHARSLGDAVILLAGCTVWVAIAKWVLEKSGSVLPRVTMRRLGLG